jgi:hypothetical protein
MNQSEIAIRETAFDVRGVRRIWPCNNALVQTDVATATRCSCGGAVSIVDDGPHWAALCHDCFDAAFEAERHEGYDAADAGDRAHVIGRGKTVDEALWAWQDAHDKAWQVKWSLADPPGVDLALQVSEEADRQRGWGYSPAPGYPTARLYGPVEASCRA